MSPEIDGSNHNNMPVIFQRSRCRRIRNLAEEKRADSSEEEDEDQQSSAADERIKVEEEGPPAAEEGSATMEPEDDHQQAADEGSMESEYEPEDSESEDEQPVEDSPIVQKEKAQAKDEKEAEDGSVASSSDLSRESPPKKRRQSRYTSRHSAQAEVVPKRTRSARRTLPVKSSSSRKKAKIPKKSPSNKRGSQNIPDEEQKDGGELIEAFDNGEEYWRVERVLEHRVAKRRKGTAGPTKLEYRIKWANYNEEDPMWYPEENLTEYAVNLYHSLLQKKKADNDDKNQQSGCKSTTATKSLTSPTRRSRRTPPMSVSVASPNSSETRRNTVTNRFQEDEMEWGDLESILEHKEEISRKGRKSFLYRVQWNGCDDVDPNYYPGKDISSKARKDYWERWHAQEQQQQQQQQQKGKRKASNQEKKSPTTPHQAGNSVAEYAALAGEELSTPADEAANATVAGHSERVFSDIELGEDINHECHTTSECEQDSTQLPTSRPEEIETLPAASSISESHNPVVSGEEDRGNPSRNAEDVVKLPLEVVEQSLLSLTRCPSCSCHFTAELQSEHCPYMSQGCSHSVCTFCVSDTKSQSEQDGPDPEWWACPVAGCQTERAFSASRPPSANVQLLNVIVGMRQLLDRKQDVEA